MNVMLHGTSISGAATGAGVDEVLVAELRMLCRGLAYSSFAMLAAVHTVVRLPDDEASERVLCQACAVLAGEFGLQSSVYWEGHAWAVCFSRPVADEMAAQKVKPALADWSTPRRAGLSGRCARREMNEGP